MIIGSCIEYKILLSYYKNVDISLKQHNRTIIDTILHDKEDNNIKCGIIWQ